MLQNANLHANDAMLAYGHISLFLVKKNFCAACTKARKDTKEAEAITTHWYLFYWELK